VDHSGGHRDIGWTLQGTTSPIPRSRIEMTCILALTDRRTPGDAGSVKTTGATNWRSCSAF
jgi:hypothetical protein